MKPKKGSVQSGLDKTFGFLKVQKDRLDKIDPKNGGGLK